MNSNSQPMWLVVKCLPPSFTAEDIVEFLKYFGANIVKVTEADKTIAFAKFSSHDDCAYSLLKLHQQEVLGERLVVEFSDDEPSETKITSTNDRPQSDGNNTVSQQLEELRRLVNEIGIEGQTVRLSTKLKYAYPSPTPDIIQNINNALLTVPKFYTQVLHLMNKMNLPPPFGPVSQVSQVLRSFYVQQTETPQHPPRVCADETAVESVQDIEVPEDDESELESDDEKPLMQPQYLPQPKKRSLPERKVIKKPKLLDLMKPVATQKKEVKEAVPVHEVFESPVNVVKSIQINMKKTIDTEEKESVSEVLGGFGQIEPVKTSLVEEAKNAEDDVIKTTFISSQELKENQLPKEEWIKISAFKNYTEGEVSERLYIKNLTKKVEKEDLNRVYGRYVDWSNQVHVNIFDVRVMQEGRMKGQAFVNLPTSERALKAVKETNGFILKGKPMVVQFARSAKPKSEQGL